ncbi:MAG: acyloxyacyl hydrolase [Flavobacteriales bacterium]
MFRFSLGFLVFFPGILIAQKSFGEAIEFRQKVGFLAAHRGVMAHMPRDLAVAGELSWVRRTAGSKAYHAAYRFPTVGATVFVGTVGNNDLLGTLGGAYGFTELPMAVASRYRLDFKLGLGLGYCSKPYDPVLNPGNVALGSHINGLICLGIKSTYAWSKNTINLGLDITHFSNAAWKVPNFGINMPYVSLGYARTLVPTPILSPFEGDVPLPSAIPYDQWLYSATAILSAKQLMPIGGKRYPVYALNLSGKRFFNPKAGLELSLDVIAKQAIKAYLPYIEKRQIDLLQVGAYAAYLVPMDRFHFVFGMGAYLRDKYSPEHPLYHRIGAKYAA